MSVFRCLIVLVAAFSALGAVAQRPDFCVSVPARNSTFLQRGPDEFAADFPGYEWMYCEPNSIAKFRRMGFNCVNLFADPTCLLALLSEEPQCNDPQAEFERFIRTGTDQGWLGIVKDWEREPDGWSRYLEELRALGDMPCYIDFGVYYPCRIPNNRNLLKGRIDVDSLSYAKPGKKMSAFNISFRLTRPEGPQALARMWAHTALLCKQAGVKPWAYKILNEPTYTDDSPELRELARKWLLSRGVEPTGAAMDVAAIWMREKLSARATTVIKAELRKVEPAMPMFIQIHSDAWFGRWNGIGLYEANRNMEMISIGTGGHCYVGEEPTKGVRFVDARNPLCMAHLGKIAYYRAMARGKPLVASELYVGGGYGADRKDRSRHLEAGLWHAAADGIEMANLWEWGTPRLTKGTASFTLYDPNVCGPVTWDSMPRIVKEINSVSDLFPKGVRDIRTKVACLFSNSTRLVAEKGRAKRFCEAVSALEFAHIRADAIIEDQLPPGDDCHIGEYSAIVAMGVDAISPEADAALVKWMDAGGRLVVIDSPMDRDGFGREVAGGAKCLAHANTVKLADGQSLFRIAAELKKTLAGFGVNPTAEILDASTGDVAPLLRVVRTKGRDGLTGWFFVNYSTSPRLIVVRADDLAGEDVAAVSPFGENAWPVSDGRMVVLVPGTFHAIAVSGRRALLERRFGKKKRVGAKALKAKVAVMDLAGADATARPSDPLDISMIANGGFDNKQNFPVDTVWADGHGRNLVGVPFHMVTFNDTRFNIIRFDYNQNRTTLAMRSATRPDGVADTGAISVGGKKVDGFAFLHAATHAKEGDVAYAFEVRYEDGECARQRVTVGSEIGSWHVPENNAELKSRCVFKNYMDKGIFFYEWKNPRPSVPVTALRIVGGKSDSCGNIVAISAVLPSLESSKQP